MAGIEISDSQLVDCLDITIFLSGILMSPLNNNNNGSNFNIAVVPIDSMPFYQRACISTF